MYYHLCVCPGMVVPGLTGGGVLHLHLCPDCILINEVCPD